MYDAKSAAPYRIRVKRAGGVRISVRKGVSSLRILTAILIALFLLLVSCTMTESPESRPVESRASATVSSEAGSETASTAESSESAPASEPDASSEEPVKAARLLDVPLICQYPALPTGCESVAATMLLNYYDVPVDAETFAGEWLECEPYYYEDGVMYGADPTEKFVGDPFSQHSYGCFAPVVAKAINGNCFTVKAIPLSGVPFEDLLARVSRGDPVLIWATGQMMEPMQGAVWTLPNGKKLQWKRGEHCLVLVGYDSNCVYLNDPDSGERIKYDRELVAARYEAMGSWALEIVKK